MEPVRVDTETTATVHLTGDPEMHCCIVIYEKNEDWFKAGIQYCRTHRPDAWDDALLLWWADGIGGNSEHNTGCVEKPILYPNATWTNFTIEFNPDTWPEGIAAWYSLSEEERIERSSLERRSIPHAMYPPEVNEYISRIWYLQTEEYICALMDFDPIRRKEKHWMTNIEIWFS